MLRRFEAGRKGACNGEGRSGSPGIVRDGVAAPGKRLGGAARVPGAPTGVREVTESEKGHPRVGKALRR